jgi:hypothetical protein
MKFDVVGSDDLTFPVTIEGTLTVKELCDKVQTNHQNVLTSIGQGLRSDFLLALRYKESHTLPSNEVISHVLSDGEKLIAIWASTIGRIAPSRHKTALIKLAQHVCYANGSFYCTLGIIDSLSINSSQVQDISKASAPKKPRPVDAAKPSAVSSSTSAPAAVAVGSSLLPIHSAAAQASSHSSGSSSSSVSSSSSAAAPQHKPLPAAPVVNHTVQIADTTSESGSSTSSSVSSSSSSSSVSSTKSSSSSATSSSQTAVVQVAAVVKSTTPSVAVPAARPAAAAKAPATPRPASAAAGSAKKAAGIKAPDATVPAKPAAPMPSPAAPTEKSILAQISSGVALPSSTPKKRGARGGKNSASNKAKTATST